MELKVGMSGRIVSSAMVDSNPFNGIERKAGLRNLENLA